MRKAAKWLALAVLGLLVLAGAGLVALQHWVGSDDFRARVQAQAATVLGVEVRLGRIDVDPWPVPAVALADLEVLTRPALLAQRVEVRPSVSALLGGRVELATVLVRKAELPQAGVDQLLAAMKKQRADAPADTSPQQGSDRVDPIPRRVVLDDVTWRSAGGEVTAVDADARLAPGGRPETVSLKVLAGRFKGAKAELERKEAVWNVKVQHAGGSLQGTAEVQAATAAGRDMQLTAQFETRDMELTALAGKPAGAGGTAGGSPLTGKLEATTTLSARAPAWGGMLDALQTQSKFTVRNAVVHGIDLARAVKTIGLSRGGETRLDTLAGQLNTRGKAVTLNNLVASSGILSASGNAAVAPNRALSGRINVSLGAAVLGDAVGVPLQVGGTLDAPEVTLTRAGMVGAAIGTVVLPGVGTGAGASLGDKIGGKLKGLFGK